ncbi:hypothetical protein CONLIGDRAFT_298672 [Coniochaeta ligniaria NRRL 30616]|uniref:Uncharacterized protein n=1 Tax=Coniochaeta ligniaria NRRL 30616 TaxID=1408157 RepID=A0A1J7ITP4_9PEZI|nr:hypothetical protein CONLIGDRAFT_298672 [Coniochaeta ligniaria NRRL 30616]
MGSWHENAAFAMGRRHGAIGWHAAVGLTHFRCYGRTDGDKNLIPRTSFSKVLLCSVQLLLAWLSTDLKWATATPTHRHLLSLASFDRTAEDCRAFHRYTQLELGLRPQASLKTPSPLCVVFSPHRTQHPSHAFLEDARF